MEPTIVAVALIAYVGFRQWLQHQRRMMLHRERLAAVERGTELPAVEQEVERRSWNVQRILLLAGLCWMAIGVAAFVVLSVLTRQALANHIPDGLQWIGLAPLGIGLAHLAVYVVERRRER